MDLDTGPWTRKSSTLCSLLLLLTIAALAVPGQVNSEEVGFGKHTKNGENVTLTANTVTSDKVDVVLGSCRFKERYPDACNVTIEDDYIELRYNYGSKGCTVDLLSTNAANINAIKVTAGVRGDTKGGLSKCLDIGHKLGGSYNNTLPFAYSVNNSVIEQLNNRQYNPGAKCNVACQAINGKCMRNTSLQVSWSQLGGNVYAHTYLIGEDKGRGLSPSKAPISENMTLDLVINTASGFTMKYAGDKGFNASDGAVCVPESTPLFEPKAWTITDGEHSGKHLLVFSLLRQNAAYTYKVNDLAEPPNGPHCELFVRFSTSDYSLLFVDNSPTTTQSTTTTVTTTAAKTSEMPGTTTSSATTPSTTANNFTSIRTTSQAATKCPEQREECGGAPYLAIGIAAAGLIVGIIIAVLVWLWMKNKAGKDTKKGGKQDAERAEEDRLLALYKAEEKTKGKKVVGTFAAWKKNRKEGETKTAVELSSIDDLIAAIWKRVEKKKAMDKLQYLVDQFEKQKEKELFEREYKPELKKKGLAAVGSFEEWKKNKNIAATFTLDDGTRTAIEYQQPKVIEKIVEVERVIIEKAEEWTIEENPTIEEQERLAEIKAANRGAVDGVEVPMSEEEQEVDERWIPPSEPNNNPSENSLL
uniref:Uncharacterized protein n=1 Tax=Meloidogyne enterolobii TaxID=390850 RepID=A0A6V7W7Z8_MELEN|nr:unnamed protein product [Meloidogyne enterolobii]